MHGPAAPALAPALALISHPSYVSLAIIGAIAVVVYEIRRLIGRLFSRSVAPAPRCTAKRAPLVPAAEPWHTAGGAAAGHDNAPELETVVPDRDRTWAVAPARARVLNATARRQSPEREQVAEPPSLLRKEIVTPHERASIPGASIALVRDGNVARIERDSPGESVAAANSLTSRSRPAGARDVRMADERSLELRTMGIRDRARLLAFARRLPSLARIELAVDLNNTATLDTRIGGAEATDAYTVVAYREARLVGYASLRRGAAPWTRHAGEICIVVGSTRRDEEIGDCLGREMVARALDVGLKKITARTIDNRSTRAVFARLGFSDEALLSDHIIDEKGCTYDMLIMSGTREQLVDAVPPELRRIASGRSETDAGDPDDAPPKETPRGALLAGVTHAPSSHTVNAEVPITRGHGEVSRRPEDARLAAPSLVAVPAGDALDTHDTLNAEEATASRVRVALTRGQPRRTAIRRPYLIAAMVGAIFVLAFVGIYVTNRHASPRKLDVLGASARPTEPATFVPGPAFESTNVGSGGVFLAVVRPSTTVRVSVDRDVVGTWFWCVESSFRIPLAEHFCAGASNSEPGPGELVSQAVIRIDPSWPADAVYFVQMYCEKFCVWHAQVVSQ